MGKRQTRIIIPPSKPQYKSATCGLGNAVDIANDMHNEGYAVKWCFSVIVKDDDGVPVQALYLLAEKSDAM